MTQPSRIDGLPDLPMAYEYVYGWNGGHRSLSSNRWNGMQPDTSERVYTADQMNAHYLKGYEAGSAAAAQAAKQVPEGWIVVKEHVWDQGDGERPTLAYLWPAEFNREIFTSFEAASQFIHEPPSLPLGWVALKIAAAPSATSLAEAAEAGQVEERWTIIAPDGWKLTGDKPIALIVEANKHEREINPAEADRQNMNLMESIAEEQAEHERDRAELVNRFLRWKLPADFSPDAGITFKRVYNETSPFGPQNHEPTGTNLLSGAQARAMLDFVLDCDEGDRELAHRSIAATPASPQAPAPQAVVGEASPQEAQRTRAIRMAADALSHAYVRAQEVEDRVMYRSAGLLLDMLFATPQAAEPASAAPHQGADALREALGEIEWSNDSKWQSDRAREALARHFHDTYERLAPSFGYETKPSTKVFDAASTNGRLMIATCGEILAALAQHQAPQQGGQKLAPTYMQRDSEEQKSDDARELHWLNTRNRDAS